MNLAIVLVVYRRALEQVPCWRDLCDEISRPTDCSGALAQLIVYDNSPEARSEPSLSERTCVYVHDPRNGGTAGAYAFAADFAMQRGIEWLLLLDHDTRLPAHFFDILRQGVAMPPRATVGALVPWVVDCGRAVSPARITLSGTVKPIAHGGTLPGAATALSSGSALRVGALCAILPFPKGLWLDYVDHWMFARLREHGWRVEPYGAILEHDLSVNRPAQLTRRRLESILDGEKHFMQMLSWPARITYPLRLAGRLLRYAFASPARAAWLASWVWTRSRAASS